MVTLVPIEDLRPLERVFPAHLDRIADALNRDGIVRKPIIVDRATGAVMDGSHRYAALLRDGYRLAPVRWADYDDENIRVGSRLADRMHTTGPTLTKQDCRAAVKAGRLLAARSTRHFFPWPKTDDPVPLSDLHPGPARNVDRLLTDADEQANHVGYLAEAVEYRRAVATHLAELATVCRELPGGTVLFPGKFDPPHVGHVRTIVRLAGQHPHVVVAVTGDRDRTTSASPTQACTILRDAICASNVTVTTVTGRLTARDGLNGLPPFDLLASGNPDVLGWAQTIGIPYVDVPRSEGPAHSARELRRLAS